MKFLRWLFRISDRTHCDADCFFYSHDQCKLYGTGHRSVYPCPEYLEY